MFSADYNEFEIPFPLTEEEEKAWKLYCDETAGGLDVKDFWEELPLYVQHIYLEKIKNEL